MLKSINLNPRKLFHGFSFTWLKVSVIVGVIIASISLPFVATRFSLRYLNYLVALFPAIGVLLIIFREPVLGLVLTLLGGIFIPFTGPGGINAVVLGLMVVIAVWILEMMVKERSISLISSRAILPAFVFVLIAVTTLLLGQLPWYPLAQGAPLDAQVGGFFIYFLSAATLLLAAHLIRSEVWLQRLTWTFIIVGGAHLLASFLRIDVITRLYQNGFVAQSMFWTWLVALALGQGVFNQKLQWRYRAMLLGLVLLAFYIAYVQNGAWKSGYLPALAAAGVIILFRYPKFTAALIPLWILGAWYLGSQAIDTDFYSYGTRLDAWKIVLELARVNLFFGLGFGNYYFFTSLIPIRGWYVNFNSHSQYVDIIAQSGLVGLIVFFWIFLELGRSGWNLRTTVDKGFSQGFVYGVMGGLAGTLAAGFLVDWVLPFVYNIGFDGFRASILPWLFMGGLVALEKLGTKAQEEG